MLNSFKIMIFNNNNFIIFKRLCIGIYVKPRCLNGHDSIAIVIVIARPRFELGSKTPKASMLVRYIRYLVILPGFPGILL